jgi:hypothetical protein
LGAPDGTAVWRHSSDSHAFKGTRSMLNHSKAGPRASVRLATLSSASLSSEVRIGIDRSTSRMTNATPPAHLQVHLPLLRLREDADAQQACSSRDSSHSEPVPALKPPRRVRGLPPNGLAPLLFSHCPPFPTTQFPCCESLAGEGAGLSGGCVWAAGAFSGSSEYRPRATAASVAVRLPRGPKESFCALPTARVRFSCPTRRTRRGQPEGSRRVAGRWRAP